MADTIEDLLKMLAQAKAAETRLAEVKADIEARLVTMMDTTGRKNVKVALPSGDIISGTLVKGERVIMDSDRLKGAVGANSWKKITKQVLDSKLLEAAVAMGEIDPNVVASCSEVRPNKPFIKVSGNFSTDELDSVQYNAVSILNVAGNMKPAARKVKPRGK